MNQNEIKQAIQEWTEINTPLGRELGYPECCIKEFCNQPPVLLRNLKPTEVDRMRYKAGCVKLSITGQTVFTGFIPCAAHAKEILSGKITLSSLIKKRHTRFATFPFYNLNTKP